MRFTGDWVILRWCSMPAWRSIRLYGKYEDTGAAARKEGEGQGRSI